MNAYFLSWNDEMIEYPLRTLRTHFLHPFKLPFSYDVSTIGDSGGQLNKYIVYSVELGRMIFRC